MASNDLDDAIRAAYRNTRVGLDELLVDPSRAMDFANSVRSLRQQLVTIEDRTILKRAMQLRKRGESRGGLPRIE